MITKKDLRQLRKGIGKEIVDSSNKLREELKTEISASAKSLEKKFENGIETAVAQVINAVIKHTASKDDLKDFKEEVTGEFKEVKRQINDLKADKPTPQEFTDHEKRISKLESAAFPS